ncbi:hypothetical protein B0H63DRAFT_445109 [Podospora didyma]|uniref:Uncharacterized protein n=1 Tax=Podospora didyma TaxID=330526 RepID=A0AAE0P831_9PEZI|nr:hypothetical protein B0H63DRAFT_445109 [Podospora didyma]
MFDWIRHEFLVATADSAYGPRNPLRERVNEEARYTFHPAIMFLMLNFMPTWVFKSAITARGVLTEAFLHYHTQGQFNKGSAFIQRWTEHFVSWGIPGQDIARFHNGGLFAQVANTMPAAFWMVYRVFSDAGVVREFREEVSKAVAMDDDDGGSTCSINVRHALASCPVLASTFQEVFRVHGMANSIRVATEDHMLDGKYLIKKGGLFMMPARVQHRLRDV